ncbi:hypothetical protein [Microbacterium elymi]|uniref:Tetracycline repressor TetR C-terminal domain-containing protein n=1 Tax=Microbacterium elymi TaxID=2909587 RepID=A0ABY5NLA2_9MICO|nr:hypothetical protein [Microbacterium elymi]UUT35960.1 hypothetical protein L2X98_22835 [Microbacterium elymi]
MNGANPWFDAPLRPDPQLFPRFAALANELVDLQDDELFLLGVEFVIDSARRLGAAAD